MEIRIICNYKYYPYNYKHFDFVKLASAMSNILQYRNREQ